MASSGKKKTTMAKLTRESRLREKRMEKQARKLARKEAAARDPQVSYEDYPVDHGMDGSPGAEGVSDPQPTATSADQLGGPVPDDSAG